MQQEDGVADQDSEKGKKRFLILLLTAFLLVLAGGWGAQEAGSRADLRMRRELLRKATSVAAALPINQIQGLSFTIDDLNRPEYLRLCNYLKAYAENVGLKSVYTMALRADGKLVFGPESLEPESPGDVYLQPSKEDFEIFETGKPFVIGPFPDEYGTFVSASAPIVHPQTGEVLASVGIDVEAAAWKEAVRRAQRQPLLLVLVPLGMLALTGILIKIRHRLHVVISPERLHHLETMACAVIMLLLTAGTTLLFYASENSAREEAFHAMSLLKGSVYADELKRLQGDLETLANFFESCKFVDREEFRNFCAGMVRHHTVQAGAWCPKVPVSKLKEFEREQRVEGLTDYSVKNLSDAESEFDMAYPVQYVEPHAGHELAVGCNLYSEASLRAAIDEANRTGYTTATAPIGQAALPGGSPEDLFIFLPVQGRRQQGMLFFALRPQLTMARLEQRTTAGSSGLAACLLEISPGKEPVLLANSQKGKPGKSLIPLAAGLHRIVPLHSFGRTYALVITPEARWYKDHPLRDWKIALFAGLALSALLTGVVSVLTNRPILLEKLVKQRTAELAKSERRLKLATTAANIGVWDRDIAGNKLVWNERMHRLYGLEKESFNQTLQAWEQCIHPGDFDRVMEELSAAERNENEFDTEYRIIRPDGRIRHIRAHAHVMHASDGTPVRITGVNQDITDAKDAEEELRKRNRELERFNRLAVGRELRMIELKEEINRLSLELGQPKPYLRDFSPSTIKSDTDA